MTKTIVAALIAIFLLAVAENPVAEIYKWVDDEGRIHFTDISPSGTDSETVTLSKINTYTRPQLTDSEVDLTDSEAGLGSRRKVVMYSAEWCGVCKRAKAYFRKKRISFSEYDVENSEKGRRDFKKLSGRGVPVIFVGEKRMNGFSVGTFEKMYGG